MVYVFSVVVMICLVCLFALVRKESRLAILLLVLSSSLIAAPAPQPKYRGDTAVCAGDWELEWNGIPYDLELKKSGNFYCYTKHGRAYWYGSWLWDESTRTLWMSERHQNDEEENWKFWSVQLDKQLKGKSMGAYGDHNTVSIKRNFAKTT